jgi:hypothetical protein
VADQKWSLQASNSSLDKEKETISIIMARGASEYTLNNQRVVLGGFLILATAISISRILLSAELLSLNNVDHLEDYMIQPVNRVNTSSARTFSDKSANLSLFLPPKKSTNSDSPSKPLRSLDLAIDENMKRTLSICLLLKDDNDILNEWMAYHYHALNLRHMVVAVDPSSRTSPSALFQRWRDQFGMVIDEWTDADYMPDYFLRGQFDQVPSFLPTFVKENVSASVWHEDTSNITQLEDDLLAINNHRFRQVTFVSRCFQSLRSQGKRWVAHIDTDEYIVINPRLLLRPKAVKGVDIPGAPHRGSLLNFLEDMFVHYPKRLTRKCLMMPTLLFGSIENPNNRTKVAGWNTTNFETIRWTHHAIVSDIVNGMQKAIVDVSVLPDNHAVFEENRIKSVHQPLDYPECRKFTLHPEVDAVRLFPLTVNHYVGSLERYLSRSDVRRNIDIYKKKARVNGCVDGGWIQGWLSSFESKHGAERSNSVLAAYRN